MKWIKVKDRVPNIDELVLVCRMEEGDTIYIPRVSYVTFENRWVYSMSENTSVDLDYFTHWIQLPEKPE